MLKLRISESMDFGYSMFRVVHKKQLTQKVNDGIYADNKDIIEAIEQIENNMTLAQFRLMTTLTNKYQFHNYLTKLACYKPDLSETAVIDYIRNFEPDLFYKEYIEYVLSVDDCQDEDKIKEAIKRLNRVNTMKEAPSYTTVKYIKGHTDLLRDELVVFLEYYLPIYLEAKEKTLIHSKTALKTYQKYFPDIESFLKVYPVVDSDVFPKDTDINGFVTAFMDMSMYITTAGEQFHLIIGSSLTYALSDEFKDKQKRQFFKCLSDPTKLKILASIKEDELCAMDLVEKFKLTKSTISHHIGQLLSAQLIYLSRVDGKKIYYSVNSEHMEKVFKETLEDYSGVRHPL